MTVDKLAYQNLPRSIASKNIDGKYLRCGLSSILLDTTCHSKANQYLRALVYMLQLKSMITREIENTLSVVQYLLI